MVPVSASEMSISVFSIATTRSDSSRQSASASRSAAASPRDCSAVSAMPRRRIIGVRRSCATLSSAPRMPAMSASMRSSIALTWIPSSSSASPVFRGRHTRLHLARCAGSRARSSLRRVTGCSAEARERRAAREADANQRREVDEQDAGGSVARSELAPGRALADLEQRAVAESHRRDFERLALVRSSEHAPRLLAGRRRVELREVVAAPSSVCGLRYIDVLERSDGPHEERLVGRRRSGRAGLPRRVR